MGTVKRLTPPEMGRRLVSECVCVSVSKGLETSDIGPKEQGGGQCQRNEEPVEVHFHQKLKPFVPFLKRLHRIIPVIGVRTPIARKQM